jgi:hypothetical protein
VFAVKTNFDLPGVSGPGANVPAGSRPTAQAGRRKNPAASDTVRPSGSGFDVVQLLQVLMAVRNGDFSVRLPSDWTGVEGKIADACNDIIASNEAMALELERVSRVVGKEGKIRQRASFSARGGAWRGMEESINNLISDLAWPITEVTRSIGAVAKGDLTQTMSLDVEGRPLVGEFRRNAKLVNTMIGQLSVFTSEVTRVAREVGTEGKLGGQVHLMLF